MCYHFPSGSPTNPICERGKMNTEKKFQGGCLNCSYETSDRNELELHNCKKLEEFTVTARLINTYEIKVMATDEYAALKSLDEWVAEDFTDYITNQQWDMEAI